MTVALKPSTSADVVPPDADELLDQEHIVLSGISWKTYESLLADIGDRSTRLTYYRGWLEIMAPLSAHEIPGNRIGRLLEFMCFERKIPLLGAGSTTFRREDAAAGLEPDECYYVNNESRVRSMKRFDPFRDPPPDLAVEIDITRRSVGREPIYAELGVPEIWRYDGESLTVRLLQNGGRYNNHESSILFPFLPINHFVHFVHRFQRDDPNSVLVDFQSWLRTLP